MLLQTVAVQGRRRAANFRAFTGAAPLKRPSNPQGGPWPATQPISKELRNRRLTNNEPQNLEVHLAYAVSLPVLCHSLFCGSSICGSLSSSVAHDPAHFPVSRHIVTEVVIIGRNRGAKRDHTHLRHMSCLSRPDFRLTLSLVVQHVHDRAL